MNMEEYRSYFFLIRRLETTCSGGYSVKRQHSSANFETEFQNILLAFTNIVDVFYYKTCFIQL